MDDAFDAGMALAAVLSGDGSGSRAADGLSPALAERLARRLEPMAAGSREARATAIAALGRALRPVPRPSSDEPRRVLSVLAPEVARSRGQIWLASVPGHRAGWSAPADLRAALVRWTASSSEERVARDLAALEAITWPA